MKKYMYIPGVIILLMSLFVISCNEDENTFCNNSCNVSDPVKDLAWLKNDIEEIEQNNNDYSEYAFYMTAMFKGETVFFYGNCHPAINYVSFLLTCNGDTLGYTEELYDHLNTVTLLWQHEESECNFD